MGSKKVLRGHPNIVNIIDATSNPTGNGTFEVFILMEFCPGGGIIDMMNRRLRERLTEAEILQIFVDVCEVCPLTAPLHPVITCVRFRVWRVCITLSLL